METNTTSSWFYQDFYKQLLYMMFNEENEFCVALAYLLTFKKHQNLKVIPHTYSIEIANDSIHIYIIHTVLFQQKEYEKVKHLPNVHFVVLNAEIAEMYEFKKMKKNIKFISKEMLVVTVEALTTNKFTQTIQRFKALNV